MGKRSALYEVSYSLTKSMQKYIRQLNRREGMGKPRPKIRRRVVITLELETDRTVRELRRVKYAALGLDSNSILFDGTIIQAQVNLVQPKEEAI